MSAPKRDYWNSLSNTTKVIGLASATIAVLGVGAWLFAKSRKTGHTLLSNARGPASREGSLFPSLVQFEEATAEVQEMFEVSVEDLEKVASGLQQEMRNGLLPNNESSLKMLPSFVDKLVARGEGQHVLALDMGGTNLRIMLVQVNPGGQAVITQVSKHKIPEHLMLGKGKELFDFIAECVVQVMGHLNQVKLGFTFSFPTLQTAIDHGHLVEWTKGFKTTDVEGHDVAELLNNSLAALGKQTRVTALVNDTVGTMLTGAFAAQDPNTLIGVILGTGSNACYMESADNIKKWSGEPIPTGQMIINIEWGNYDSPIYTTLPQNKFDIELDELSLNPKKQHFEKMLSGMYLGELTRLVLQAYCAQINLFGGQTSPNIESAYKFGTHFMSQIESDNSTDLAGVQSVLKSIGIHKTTHPVRQFVKGVVHLVAMRSARLAAAGIVAIVRQMNRVFEPVRVAIDGAVFENYPGYANAMNEALVELGCKYVTLTLAKDGSGVGAALTAHLMGI